MYSIERSTHNCRVVFTYNRFDRPTRTRCVEEGGATRGRDKSQSTIYPALRTWGLGHGCAQGQRQCSSAPRVREERRRKVWGGGGCSSSRGDEGEEEGEIVVSCKHSRRGAQALSSSTGYILAPPPGPGLTSFSQLHRYTRSLCASIRSRRRASSSPILSRSASRAE